MQARFTADEAEQAVAAGILQLGMPSSPSPSPGCWSWCCRRWAVVTFLLATLNAVAQVYLGPQPAGRGRGAAVGLAIAAALDLLLDVARDYGRS